MKRPVPPWKLEWLALNALSADERAKVTLSPEDVERLAALDASNREILMAYPPQAMARQIERKLSDRSSQVPGWSLGLAFAVPVLVAFWFWMPRIQQNTEESILSKGLHPELRIYRQEAEAPERLVPNSDARPGDLLQLAYVSAGRSHGVVFSVDGAGNVTLHFPEDAGGDTALRPTGEVSLSQSYVLDAAPRFERFIFVTAADPIDVGAVLANAKQWGAHAESMRLTLPTPSEQFSISLHKVAP